MEIGFLAIESIDHSRLNRKRSPGIVKAVLRDLERAWKKALVAYGKQQYDSIEIRCASVNDRTVFLATCSFCVEPCPTSPLPAGVITASKPTPGDVSRSEAHQQSVATTQRGAR